MNKKDQLAMLRKVSLFEGMSDRELKAIREAAKEVAFDEGSVIVEENATEGISFHLILEGRATVTAGGRKRATLGPGDYFGEMSLIDGGPRSATVRAETPVRTLALASWAFTPLLKKSPGMAQKMLTDLTRRLRAAERSFTH